VGLACVYAVNLVASPPTYKGTLVVSATIEKEGLVGSPPTDKKKSIGSRTSPPA
jgi:hypothetical protein